MQSENVMSTYVDASPVSRDSDRNQFDKLFTELVAESIVLDDEDPKVADAMKWFKRASVLNFCTASA